MSLSCPCNTCGSSSGCGCSYNVIIDAAGDGNTYNFQSIGLNGIPILDGVDGLNVNFRTVVSGNGLIGITLDAGNHSVVFTADATAIAAAIPDATTTQRGVLETATDAEAIAKAATDKIITPSNLAALGASTAFSGFIEIATNAEAITGTSTTLAVTPANLTAVFSTLFIPTTFADAATRAGQAPDFIGQFGGETDNGTGYVSFGVAAGNWRQIMLLDTSNTVSGSTTITGAGTVVFSTTALTLSSATITFTGGTINFANELIKVGGVLADDDILTTDGSGELVNLAINTFLSTQNTSTGYGVSNYTPTKTLDAATAMLPDVLDFVCTLAFDLMSNLKPNA